MVGSRKNLLFVRTMLSSFIVLWSANEASGQIVASGRGRAAGGGRFRHSTTCVCRRLRPTSDQGQIGGSVRLRPRPPVRPLTLAPSPPLRMAIANSAQIPEEVSLDPVTISDMNFLAPYFVYV